jgi:FHS family Na+ dependent glucose MFS transporter 1
MQPNGKRSTTIGYYAAFTGLGLAAAALGPTLPGLAQQVQTPLSEISFLFTASSSGYLLGSFQGGRFYDRMPGHPVMAGSLLLMALMLTLAPLIPVLWVLALVMLILGMAEGVLDVGGNTLLVWLHGHAVGPYMNGLHFFFGVGAFLTPVIVAQALHLKDDISWAYWVLALLMVPAAVWLLRLPSPAAPANSANEAARPGSSASPNSGRRARIVVALIALLLFLYVGAEAGIGGWIFSYAVALELGSETIAAYLNATFWGALTLGRLLGIPIAVRFRPRWILLGDALGCLVSAAILVLNPQSPAATWIGTFGMGIFIASVFPVALALAERQVTITGRTTGWFLVGASLGGMTVPWLMGQIFELIGPRMTMVIVVLDLILATGILAVLLVFLNRKLSFPDALVYNGQSK